MMKKTGYSPEFAGAVESVASVGGQILPSVMGAIAFVMAEYLGVPYKTIVKAAAIPAILYFLTIFMSVHFEAGRLGLKPVPSDEIPSFRKTFLDGWYYLIPIAVLLYFLLDQGSRPEVAGLYAIPVLVATSFINKNKKFMACSQKAV